jgi:hypothetical protein
MPIAMKLGKTLGRIGFVIGFLGPVLFYLSPPWFPTFGSGFVCPACVYVDIPVEATSVWVLIALATGLCNGITYALTGFVTGYLISMVTHSPRTHEDTKAE